MTKPAKKRILINTNHFYPEVFRVNDVAFDLAARGHEVTVITCIPNYPQGTTFPGYGLLKRRREMVRGVDVIRVPVIPRGKGGGLRLMLNYMSYLVSATLRVLLLVVQKRFDCIVVHETSPVTVGIPAAIVKMCQRIPMYFWVLDLWPESLTAAGGINNKAVLGFFTRLTRWLYGKSDKILISSEGFRRSICEKGDFGQKLVHFPNWCEDELTASAGKGQIPPLPAGFRIMYAGNIGEAQDFEAVMQAALALRGTDVRWLLVGDGRKREWVERFVGEHGLADNVLLLGHHPMEMMPGFFAQADIMLLSLKDELIFNLTVPAKLQTYMALGKPVIAMLNGEGAEIVRLSGCGYAVAAGDHMALAAKVRELAGRKGELAALGAKGREYYERNYSKERVLGKLHGIIEGE